MPNGAEGDTVQRYRGAADLRLWGSDTANQYSLEAKWSRVIIAPGRKPLARMRTLLENACKDSTKNNKPKGGHSERGQHKFGIAFACIESLPDGDRETLWDAMIRELSTTKFFVFDFGYAARSDPASFADKLDSDGVVLLGRRTDEPT